MKITDLFSIEALNQSITDGYIRRQTSTDGHLAILNYTEMAQFRREWTPITLACRGLIYNVDTLEILARPFPKFFNHNEPNPYVLPTNEPVTVTDKLDGSLGILYTHDGLTRIASRGSFTSEQSIIATRIFHAQYATWEPPKGVTVLFEIIYPSNRIVIDYGDMEDLVLLGGVDVETGKSLAPDEIAWVGPRTPIYLFNSLVEALNSPPRKNAEGYVVHFRHSDLRVKIKQTDYIALHRIVTGWNERTVWEMLANGQDYETLLDGVPDEFHAWAMGIADGLNAQYDDIVGVANAVHHAILDHLPDGFERKEYADATQTTPPNIRPALFQLLDGRDITEWAWKQIRPTIKETTNA